MTRVHVLATGGTIASRSGEGSGATAAHAAEALLAGMDATADVEITGEDVMTVGSYRLGLPELATIARTARERAADPGIDGVVVTHGTDTMEETAFLADLLNGTDTPVVFTGAQRAADHPDTDGPRNLRQAVLAAAHPNARGLGALVAFDGVLLSARGTRKGHTMVSQPFTGGTLVGTTHGDGFHLHARPHRPGTLDLPDSGLDGVRVNLVTAHPGADPAALTWAADRGADVVVLAGGTVPDTALAEDAGLEVADGVLTDAMGRTTVPGILAVGDAARARESAWAPSRHWEPALRSGAAAAAAILGEEADAPGAPWFWSDRYDAHVEAVGDMTVPAGGRIVDREVRGTVVASFALAADGTLRGAASIDDPMTVKAARRIIDRGIVVDAAALADPAVPVKSLARG